MLLVRGLFVLAPSHDPYNVGALIITCAILVVPYHNIALIASKVVPAWGDLSGWGFPGDWMLRPVRDRDMGVYEKKGYLILGVLIIRILPTF